MHHQSLGLNTLAEFRDALLRIAGERSVIDTDRENILLILLRNPHVDRYDPADPAHPAAAAARRRMLTPSRLRVPTTLDTALPAITAPEGTPRVGLRIRLSDRAVTAGIAAKSLRRVLTMRNSCECR
jgi:hypothetical protein